MDLVGAEGSRGGTRGGRGQFTWDSVNPKERGFYLGNSTAEASSGIQEPRRRRNNAPLDWYARPPVDVDEELTTNASALRTGRKTATSHAPNQHEMPTNKEFTTSTSLISTLGEGSSKGTSDYKVRASSISHLGGSQVGQADTLAKRESGLHDPVSVRRREKAMIDAALGGRSFSEAVRAALVESESASGADDGPDSAVDGHPQLRSCVTSNLLPDVKMCVTLSREERNEKIRRKEERARRREERRARRAKRKDSSESERESLRSRRYEESDRRRRRRERESDREEYNRRSIRRPRSDADDDDDSQNSDAAHRARRRQRLR